MPPSADFQALLSGLVDAGVEFVVVGGVGAVLRGAPVTTFDLDIVHNRSKENVTRLMGFLAGIQGHYRTHPHVALSPDVFLDAGHVRLLTELGPLDALGAVGSGLTYQDLLADSSELDVGGFGVRVISLEALIAIKETVGRDKDRATLPILRRTLDESSQ